MESGRQVGPVAAPLVTKRITAYTRDFEPEHGPCEGDQGRVSLAVGGLGGGAGETGGGVDDSSTKRTP
jgi:hypothetical protein